MKYGTSFVAFAWALLACNEPKVDTSLIQIPATGVRDGSASAEVAIFSPDEAVFQYDTVVEGAVVAHRFAFKNTGLASLAIADVHSGCGCTVPQSWPRELIAPGEGGTIDVAFNTRGWSGQVDKRVTVVTNGEPSVVHLVLDGYILAPEGTSESPALPIRRH
jgi:hypothetical protein